MIGDRTSIDETNDPCPECGKPMGWTEGLLHDGAVETTSGRYGCMPCRIFAKQTESRETRAGRAEASKYVGQKNVVSKIMGKSVGRQLGILRSLQHCRTCANPAGTPCSCEGKCNCPHCLDRGNYKGK